VAAAPADVPSFVGSATIDGAEAASVGVEGSATAVVMLAGTFSGPVNVAVSTAPYAGGGSTAAGAVSASPVLTFFFDAPAAQPILVGIETTATSRRQGANRDLFTHWLNKQTNEWVIVCGEKTLDADTGKLETVVPTSVLNSPALNPSSGCAPGLVDDCEGDGGKFAVFEVAADSCATKDVPRTSQTLSGGAIAGVVIGVLAAVAILGAAAWYASTHSPGGSAAGAQPTVRSSLVVGGKTEQPRAGQRQTLNLGPANVLEPGVNPLGAPSSHASSVYGVKSAVGFNDRPPVPPQPPSIPGAPGMPPYIGQPYLGQPSGLPAPYYQF
jgi:hypothetical protein